MKTILNITNLVGTMIIIPTDKEDFRSVSDNVIKALLSALNQVPESQECNSNKLKPPVSNPENSKEDFLQLIFHKQKEISRFEYPKAKRLFLTKLGREFLV
ncbi:hypothetical protein ABF190_000786, partial [Flavobacterium psychrophilum]